MSPPKVLFLGANGYDTTRLRLSAEVRDIRRELEVTGASDAFQVAAELAVRPTDLQRLLLLHSPDLIHFSGHGASPGGEKSTEPIGAASREFVLVDNADDGFGAGLLLENDAGTAITVRPDVFADLLAIVKRDVPLRCVVLNACFTAAQAEAIAEHVDCVIGTTRAIDDDAAIAFATAFYRGLAHGKSIGSAFDLGRNEIGLRGLSGCDIPRLFLRSGVRPESVFLGKAAKGALYPTEKPPAQEVKRFEPHWAHVLEPAQHFQGRERLREELGAWLANGGDATRIIAICAIGGTGKTALVDRVLRDWLDTSKPLQGGVFVWSFYENDRVDDFFGEACRYFIGDPGEIGGRSARLSAALKDRLPHLFVLDGLETVQAEQGAGRAKGEMLDAAFRVLIRQIAARQLGQTRMLVTSRFPLCDVASWEGEGYRKIDLEDLDPIAARAILRAWGVRGDDRALDALGQRVGWHALSVRVMGAYLKHYADGDASEGLGLDLGEMARDGSDSDRKAVKLDKLLGYVAKRMVAEEREVMARLSVFPRGIKVELLLALANAGGDVAGELAGVTEKRLVLILRRLVSQGLAFSYGEANHCVYTAHPFLRDHFKKLIGVKTEDVHEVLRQKLAPSLEIRPGELPRDKDTLDRLEALIEHTRLAGEVEEASGLYNLEMGGSKHLLAIDDCWRGKRIVESFSPDGSIERFGLSLTPRSRYGLINDWGFYGSYFGDLSLAKRCYEKAHTLTSPDSVDGIATTLCNLGSIEWYQAKFLAMEKFALDAQSAASAADDLGTSLRVSLFLALVAFSRGESKNALRIIDETKLIGKRFGAIWWSSSASQLEIEFLFRLGNLQSALEQAQDSLGLCNLRGYHDEAARFRVLLGRIVLTSSPTDARNHLTILRGWISRSGNMEMTVAAQILASEIELHDNHPDLAHAEASEGLLLAETHGYGLYAIDLLLLLSRSCLVLKRPSESLRHAKLALDRSTDPECGYAWGEADALHLLGLAHRDLDERDQARQRFEQAAAIRARIEHPDAEDSRARALELAVC